MSTEALGFCLQLDRAHARLRLVLDEVLGNWHGLAFADFVLLQALAAAPGQRLALAQLVRPLGVPRSAVLRRVAPLEKTGLLERQSGASGPGDVVLRPAGARLLREAEATVDLHAARVLAGIEPAGLAAAQGVLAQVGGPA